MPGFPRVSVRASALLALALLLMAAELRWVAAFLISAAFHEMSHILVLRFLRCNIRHITIGVTGAKIHTEPLSTSQELAASLAGPMGGALLILTARWFPRLAVCAFFHSTVNLLPLYPLDGGRALRCVLPPMAYKAVQYGLMVILGLMAGRFLGTMGILGVFAVIARPVLEKFLANKRPSGYNRPTIKKEVRL